MRLPKTIYEGETIERDGFSYLGREELFSDDCLEGDMSICIEIKVFTL